ncbi:MAG: aminoacyl-tRNA hydrolase [Parcubacteria group bacterium]|nr:aminoacyl-tRNA hydrolase [Parcubacteria group bacterium]
MSYVIVGLGNPGVEYENTRHNSGRSAVLYFWKKQNFPEWEKNKKLNALVSEGKIKTPHVRGKEEKVMLVLPQTFMNKSGTSVAPLVKSKKQAERLVVVHDDLDLPLGSLKIVFNRGSGGHKGVESVKRAVKTEGFVRIRIGVSPATASGKPKKPDGSLVNDFIVAAFRPKETELLKKVTKRVADILQTIVEEGKERAMNKFN